MEDDQQGLPRTSGAQNPRVPMRTTGGQTLPPHPLDKQWFAYVDGQSYGPYSGHEIRRMIEAGQIKGSDHLCPAGGDAWNVAAQDLILGPLFRGQMQAPQNAPQLVTANGGTIVQVTNHIPQPNYAALMLDGGMAKPKSPGIALLLSFLLCGAGQMYNGQVGKGFLMLFGCVVLWFIFLGWIISIWSMIDAYSTAKSMTLRYQRLLMAGGQL